MPRGGRSSSRSSGGRSSYGGGRSSSYSRSPSSRPQQTQPQPKMQQQTTPMQSSMGGGMGQTLMTGMAFGAGSEIAHQAVRGVMGSGGHGNNQPQQQEGNLQENQPQQQQQQYQNPCQSFNTDFVTCLKDNKNDISNCQNYFESLKSCEKDMI